MPEPGPLDHYRSYLRLLAGLHLDASLRGRVDPSDIVQQTYVRAVRSLDQFRGTTTSETLAWLRKILATTLANAVRDAHREKRDIDREIDLARRMDHSSARLDNFLASDHTSPSLVAIRAERALRLASALETRPEPQRDAVARHYLLGQTLEEVSRSLDRSIPSVAGLLHRGLRSLRERLIDL